MTQDLLAAMRSATGASCHVAAIFLDVRGFTTFAGVAESVDTAMFLRSFYTKTLEKYFSDFAFFKPTGDGLLIVVNLSDDPRVVKRQLTKILNHAVALVRDFPMLLQNDIMVNFPVPDDLGVGVARGSATRLVSNAGETLDYSGRCLNLAARLMDLARPRGVVFHDKFHGKLLDSATASLFGSERVYLKGIAEVEPLDVLVTKSWTTVPQEATLPVQPTWHYDKREEYTLRSFSELGTHFWFKLEKTPRDPNSIIVRVTSPRPDRRGRRTSRLDLVDFPAAYREDDSGSWGAVLIGDVTTALLAQGVKKNWPVWTQMRYSV